MSLNKEKILSLENTQINLVFCSLIRTFAFAFTASTKINGKIASKDKETPASAHCLCALV